MGHAYNIDLLSKQSAVADGLLYAFMPSPNKKALCCGNRYLILLTPITMNIDPTKRIRDWHNAVEALSDQSGIVAKISGNFFSFAAILFLVSQIGRPSHFPIKAGHIGSIFNVMRLFAPVIGIFFIPLLPAVGNNSYTSPGKVTEENYHISLAGFSFILAPILELVSTQIQKELLIQSIKYFIIGTNLYIYICVYILYCTTFSLLLHH